MALFGAPRSAAEAQLRLKIHQRVENVQRVANILLAVTLLGIAAAVRFKSEGFWDGMVFSALAVGMIWVTQYLEGRRRHELEEEITQLRSWLERPAEGAPAA